MTDRLRIMITDCDFGSGEVERDILGPNVDLTVLGTRDRDEIIARAADAAGLFVQWAHLDADLLRALPHLRAVVRYGIGLDNIDISAARAVGVEVRNVDDYCLDEVADHAAAMVFARGRRLWEYDRSVKRGAWTPTAATAPVRPDESTVGIAGFGRIGRGVATRLKALGHRVAFWDPLVPEGAYPEFEQVSSLIDLAERSEHLSLHLPLSDETRHIVSDEVLRALGPDGHLVNTSRGPLIDEDALLLALDTGALAAASLDVVASEPPLPDTTSERIVAHPRVLSTPHMAYLSTTSLTRLRVRAAENMKAMLT